MGSAVKKVKSFATNIPLSGIGLGKELFGVGDKFSENKLNRAYFDVSKESKVQKEALDPLVQQQRNVQQGAEQAFGQANLAQTLLQRATGQAPSLSMANLKTAQDRNLASLLSAQAQSRGRATAGSSRNLARAMGEAGRQTAQDYAQAAITERRQAETDLQALRQAERDRYIEDLQRQFDVAAAPKREMQQAELGQFQADVNRANLLGQLRAQRGIAITSGIAQGATQALVGSDKTNKEQIKSAKNDMSDFLQKLSSKSYKYKDTSKPGTFEGDNYGILAQDLEKSKVGKTLVVDTENGKMIDTRKGFGAVLASMSELNKRIAQLENKRKK